MCKRRLEWFVRAGWRVFLALLATPGSLAYSLLGFHHLERGMIFGFLLCVMTGGIYGLLELVMGWWVWGITATFPWVSHGLLGI